METTVLGYPRIGGRRELKKATEFVPSIPLRDGLQRTFRWFSEPSNLRRYKGDLYNV